MVKPNLHNPLEDGFLSSLSACVRCGRCLAVCPVYDVSRHEGLSPRGKLALLEADLSRTDQSSTDQSGTDQPQKTVRPIKGMRSHLSHCLQCGACGPVCANEAAADEKILKGRALFSGKGGLKALKKLLSRDLMERGKLTRATIRSQALWKKNVPPSSGLSLRFPLNLFQGSRYFPDLAERPFLEKGSWATARTAQTTRKTAGPRVALFVGCVANYLHPETAKTAVRLLEQTGADVFIPEEQVCCGKPAHGAGDEETAKMLADKNISAFMDGKYDYIVSFCATCSEHLKSYGHLLNQGKDDPWGGQVNAGAKTRVMDMTEFLANKINQEKPGQPDQSDPAQPESDQSESARKEPLRVFYHDPCHLARKQGLRDEPRLLIERLPGVMLVGGDAEPACCGYGGLFNLWHYDLSREILTRRLDKALHFEPDIIVTSCSGCLLQFQDGLSRIKNPPGLMNLLDIMDLMDSDLR